MQPLSFTALKLRGFGPYQQEKVVTFQEGVNVLVANNEAGKSTLACGLAATIFGLPTSSDPRAFGTARFRNWDNPATFAGELFFSQGETEYHIVRDFETQAVKVRSRGAVGAWTEEVRGLHNPRSTKPNARYLQFLRSTFGLESLDLFRQTFFLEQPLPEVSALSAELQQLLSGGGHFTLVLERLKSELKSMTKRPNLYYQGVNPGRKDSQIEEIEQQIHSLEEDLSRGAQGLERIQQVSQQLDSMTEDLNGAKSQLSNTVALSQAFEQLCALRLQFISAQDKKRKVENAVKHIQSLLEKEALLMDKSQTDSLTEYRSKLQLAEMRLKKMGEEFSLDYGVAVREHKAGEDILGLVKGGEQQLGELQACYEKARVLQEEVVSYCGENEHVARDYADRVERLRDLREESSHARGTSTTRSWFAPLAVAASVTLYTTWGYRHGPVGVLLSLAIMVLGVLLHRRQRFDGAKRGVRADISRLEARMPGLAGLPVSQLTVLSLKLRQLEEAAPDTLLGDIAVARQRVGRARELYAQWQTLQGTRAQYEERRSALQAQLLARQAAVTEALWANEVMDLDELEARLQEAEDALYFSRREWRDHIRENTGLPSLEEAGDEGAIETQYQEAKASLKLAEAEVDRLVGRQTELALTLSRLEGAVLPGLAGAEERLVDLRQELQRLHSEAKATGLAAQAMDNAINRFQETYLESLAHGITGYFQQITGSDRVIAIDSEFTLKLTEASGQPVALEQLSQGARDQLYLALRLGIADISAQGIPLPLIFDDPFLTSDQERLEQIRASLQRINRQVWLLTHSDRFSHWGKVI